MSSPLDYYRYDGGGRVKSDSSYRSSGASMSKPSLNESASTQPRSYQPPAQQAQHQHNLRQHTHSWAGDDEAFVSLCKMLINKMKAYNYPANYVVHNFLSEHDRAELAKAYRDRFSNYEVSMYPESNEAPLVPVLREMREMFGSTLDILVLDSVDPRATGPSASARVHSYEARVRNAAEGSSVSAQSISDSYTNLSKEDMRDDVYGMNERATNKSRPNVRSNRDSQAYHSNEMTPANYGATPRIQNRESRHIDQQYKQVAGYARRQRSCSLERNGVLNQQPDTASFAARAPSWTLRQKEKERNNSLVLLNPVRHVEEDSSRKGIGAGGVMAMDGNANPTPSLSLDYSQSIKSQSQARQRLMKEIEKSQDLMRGAANAAERTLYDRHLQTLKCELAKISGNYRTKKETRQDPDIDKQFASVAGRGQSVDRKHFANDASLGRSVKVVAPSNLPEAYELDAKIGSQVFTASVPKGGVVRGQMFTAELYKSDDNDVLSIATHQKPMRGMQIPFSRWRDGIFDCIHETPMHPLFWHSWFCPQIALSQIMARVRVTAPQKTIRGMMLRSRIDVKTTMMLTGLFYFVNLIMIYSIGRGYLLGSAPSSFLLWFCGVPLAVADLGVLSCFYVLMARTRRSIRDAYEIPESFDADCLGWEDQLLSVFCTPCTVSQMGRHTADYNTYRASCWSETGLPDHISEQV